DFMTGLDVPIYNFAAAADDEKQQLLIFWLDVRLRVAAQMFASLSETYNTLLSDRALLELKKAEHSQRVDVWIHGTHHHTNTSRDWIGAFTRRVPEGLQCGLAWLNIKLTAGGTSLRNLFWVLVAGVLIMPFILSSYDIKFNGVSCSLDSLAGHGLADYVSQLAPSASLLLAFGFTGFSASTAGGTAVLVLAATLGLAWYSLLIPVIIRRVYR